jgi:hypothetical protein
MALVGFPQRMVQLQSNTIVIITVATLYNCTAHDKRQLYGCRHE